jgi:cytochrome oxidase assembly protein ShyY1
MPDESLRLSLDGLVAGTLGQIEADGPVRIVSASAAPPLAPSAPPRLDTLPNNHLLYAFQWFFFAAAAAVIFWLALRRRLSTQARPPKSPPS